MGGPLERSCLSSHQQCPDPIHHDAPTVLYYFNFSLLSKILQFACIPGSQVAILVMGHLETMPFSIIATIKVMPSNSSSATLQDSPFSLVGILTANYMFLINSQCLMIISPPPPMTRACPQRNSIRPCLQLLLHGLCGHPADHPISWPLSRLEFCRYHKQVDQSSKVDHT